MGVSLHEKYMCAKFAMNCMRLNALDDFWTRCVAESSKTSISKEDIESLLELVHEIQTGLDLCSRHFEWLKELHRRHPEAMSHLWNIAVADADRSNPKLVSQFFDLLNSLQTGFGQRKTFGQFNGVKPIGFEPSELIMAMTPFFRSGPSVKAEIAAQLLIITSGEQSTGDTPNDIKCGLALGAALGNAIAGDFAAFITAMSAAIATSGEALSEERDGSRLQRV
jgi:hypothetical protein